MDQETIRPDQCMPGLLWLSPEIFFQNGWQKKVEGPRAQPRFAGIMSLEICVCVCLVPMYMPPVPRFPGPRAAAPKQTRCKFFPRCTDMNCPFLHPKASLMFLTYRQLHELWTTQCVLLFFKGFFTSIILEKVF